MKLSPRKPAFLFATLCVFGSACASRGIALPLSQIEAIRLADTEAIREMHVDIRDYEHWPISHNAQKGIWYIGYRWKGSGAEQFGIHISDKTKKALLIIPN